MRGLGFGVLFLVALVVGKLGLDKLAPNFSSKLSSKLAGMYQDMTKGDKS